MMKKEGSSDSKGFSLIEISIVLVIIGLLISIGAALIGPLTKRAKFTESREVVKAAKEALSGSIVKNGNFGVAALVTTSPKSVDAWGRNLLFYADDSVWGSTKNVCGVTTTKTKLKECSNDACSSFNTKANIAFIVYSNGEDANGVCTGTGVCTGGAGTCIFPTCTGTCTAGVCSGGAGTCPTCTATPGAYCTFPVWQQAAGYNSPCTYAAANPAYQYDDIVQYVTLDEIRSAMGCSFTITNQTLPDAINGTAYNATGVQLQATGGQTPYTSWATGQAQGTCPVGDVRLVASDIGLCLDTTSGLISGTPTTAGVFNFTVTLTDASGVQTSKAFTLNVIGSQGTCLITGINIVNRTGTKYFSRNGGACSPAWAGNASLNVQAYGIGGIQQTDTYTFWTNNACTTACAGTPSLNFTGAQTTDTNQNCQIQFTNATCTRADY